MRVHELYLRSRIALLAVLALVAVTIGWIGTPSATAAPTWRPIPSAPISGRFGAAAVWTGREVLIWGGVHRGRTVQALSDGAAYDPARDRWTRIAGPPPDVIGGGGDGSTWIGHAAVFWAGNSPDGPARGAVYRPATNSWRRLPAGPLGPREGYDSFWTGDELVILGGTSGDALATPVGAAVDPFVGSWRRLPGLRALHGLRPSGIVWTGGLAYIGGTLTSRTATGWTSAPVFASYDPVTDTVAEIDINGPGTTSFSPIAWTGSDVIGTGDSVTDLLSYDPETDTWSAHAPAPCSVPDDSYPQSAWLGDRFAVACRRAAIDVYDVATDTWQRVAAGTSPFNQLSGSQIVWTGNELFVWSGVADRRYNPTPNVGARIELR